MASREPDGLDQPGVQSQPLDTDSSNKTGAPSQPSEVQTPTTSGSLSPTIQTMAEAPSIFQQSTAGIFVGLSPTTNTTATAPIDLQQTTIPVSLKPTSQAMPPPPSVPPPDTVFCFLVGEDRTKFYLNGSLFAKLSDPLNALLDGKFKEAKTKEVVWEYVSRETFQLLSEFAHSGDYSVKPLKSDPDVIDLTADSDIELVAVQTSKQKRKRSSKEALDVFGGSIPQGSGPHRTLYRVDAASELAPGESPSAKLMVQHTIQIEDDPPRAFSFRHQRQRTETLNDTHPLADQIKRRFAQEKVEKIKKSRPDLQGVDLAYDNAGNRVLSTATMSTQFCRRFTANNYGKSVIGTSTDKYAAADNTEASLGNMLMVHAQVYVLAAEKLIDGLKKLSLQKLHWILLRYPHDRARLPLLTDFARFVFDNTYGDDDSLRLMVAEHFALNVKMDDVGASDEFVQLMEEGGDFVRLFWRQTFWRRLH